MGWFGGEEEDPWEKRERLRREHYESQRRWMHVQAAGMGFGSGMFVGSSIYAVSMLVNGQRIVPKNMLGGGLFFGTILMAGTLMRNW